MVEQISATQVGDRSDECPDRPRYEPPLAVHLGDGRHGQGGTSVACQPGSGAAAACVAGFSPTGLCSDGNGFVI